MSLDRISGGTLDQVVAAGGGATIIDIDDLKAFLVRKNDDGGDVFIVDTVNGRVGINKIPDEWLHIFGSNACVKLEDDSGNFGRVKVGNSQLTIAADPDDAVPSTDIVFDMDGAEVARFQQGGELQSLHSIIAKEGFAKQLWNVAGANWETAVAGVEYYSPNQMGGIYGIIYRQYFTTSLPSSLTSGSNVSALIDYYLFFKYSAGTTRGAARGYTTGYGSTDYRVGIIMSGSSGNGNLSLSTNSYTILKGWCDYTK